MGRSSDEKGADKAVAVRRAQQKERVRLQSEIQAEQKTITTLSEEAAPLRAEFRKVEAEVGPIKYIAALIYGDAASQNMLEAAVRWVIILIVVVFDPLALTLILAANKQLEWARKGKGGWIHDEEDRPVDEKTEVSEPAVVDAEPTVQSVAVEPTPTEPVVEPEHPLTEEEREAQEMEAVERFFWRGRMIAKALDAEEAERTAQEGNAQLAELEAEPDVDSVLASLEESKAEEARLQAEARQQQELLDTLAEELVIYSTQLADEQAHRAELETQLQQSEQLKTDLKSAYDATSATNQLLAQQKAKTDRDLVDAGNNAAKLRIDINKRDQEIEKLNGWVTQLQADLMAAITVAEERNSKVNELASLLPPPPSVVVEEVIAPPVIEQVVVEAEPELEQEAVIPRPTNADEAVYDPTLGFEEKYFANYTKTAQADDAGTASHGDAGFGSAFPADPAKSDVFLRIDYLPSRLYKFNGTKWIEIDKSTNDRLAYNQAYIEHLIEKIRSGEYDIDDLNDAERNEINQYLRDHDTKL
jgi:hypothetical protein